MHCPGTLIWYEVEPRPDREELAAAILECSENGCDYVTMTGSFGDQAHADNPILKSGR